MGALLPGIGELLTVDMYPLTIYSVAAIQELHGIVQEQNCEIENLEAQNEEQQQVVSELQSRLTALENTVGKISPSTRASALGMATPALAALCLFGFLAMGRVRKGGAK